MRATARGGKAGGGSGGARAASTLRARKAAALCGLLLAWPVLAGWSFFDPFHRNVEEGNEKAAAGEPETALKHYGEAARVDPGSPIPDFNRGIVLTRDGRAEEAADAFLGAAAAEDPQVAADALYNLGTTMLEAEQYEAAVESFLRSLDLDPADEDARRNLEIALRRQQQQQQQQQDQQEQEQEQDQEQNDDQQEQPPPQDQQEQPDDQQQEESPQPDDQEQQPEDQPQEQQQQQPEKMSREDAERLLNAIQSDELKVLEQLQEDGEEEAGGTKDDW